MDTKNVQGHCEVLTGLNYCKKVLAAPHELAHQYACIGLVYSLL